MPVGDAVIKGLAMYLEEFPASEPIKGVSGHEELLLFTNRFGKRIRRQSWKDVWNKAAKKADLPPGTTPHDLRHYYASLLFAKGCSVKAVQTALRHKTATETPETYAHLWDEDPALIRQATDAELGPLVSGEDPSVTPPTNRPSPPPATPLKPATPAGRPRGTGRTWRARGHRSTSTPSGASSPSPGGLSRTRCCAPRTSCWPT